MLVNERLHVHITTQKPITTHTFSTQMPIFCPFRGLHKTWIAFKPYLYYGHGKTIKHTNKGCSISVKKLHKYTSSWNRHFSYSWNELIDM